MEPKTPVRQLISVITASSVGTLIEWYDFYIFGTLATIISTRFFPKENPTASFLATLATFAAGLLVRPFGAIFFGRLGDLIGRKYTFMITMVIMGSSTFCIGLVPTYDTIGFWAPLLVLLLRLLQGLAIGGEYGGAATFVAEHSPDRSRGFWTSWIQTTVIIGFICSLLTIILTKSFLTTSDWESWGWRIPFLASIVLLLISIWIRRNMSESPLFAKAKAEGRTSANPLKETFGNKANVRLVLLALFGLTMGVGVSGWASILYAQTFLIKTMQIDYDQANRIVMIAISLGAVTMIFFGWLSDKIGRKGIIMASLILGVICFRPIFKEIYQTANLEHKTEIQGGLPIRTNFQSSPAQTAGTQFIITQQRQYTDGTICEEKHKDIVRNGHTERIEISKTTILNASDFRKLVFLILLLATINSMGYGVLAAFLVEFFPLRIRYTSLSFPYHIGYGIFGGMSQVITTYLIAKAHDAHRGEFYLAGLSYPEWLMGMSFVIGSLYIVSDRKSVLLGVIPLLFWNNLKKWLGLLWILFGLAAAYFGIVTFGIPKILSGKQEDLIFGIIIMLIITPIASIGLIAFGKYSLQGEYNT